MTTINEQIRISDNNSPTSALSHSDEAKEDVSLPQRKSASTRGGKTINLGKNITPPTATTTANGNRFYSKIAECIVAISLPSKNPSINNNQLASSQSTVSTVVPSSDTGTTELPKDFCTLMYLWNKNKRHPMLLLQKLTVKEVKNFLHKKIPVEHREILEIENITDEKESTVSTNLTTSTTLTNTMISNTNSDNKTVPISSILQNESLRIKPEELAYMRYNNETEELTITHQKTLLTLALTTPSHMHIAKQRKSNWHWRKLARRIILDFARYLEESSIYDATQDNDPAAFINQPLVILTGKIKLPEENDFNSYISDISKFDVGLGSNDDRSSNVTSSVSKDKTVKAHTPVPVSSSSSNLSTNSNSFQPRSHTKGQSSSTSTSGYPQHSTSYSQHMPSQNASVPTTSAFVAQGNATATPLSPSSTNSVMYIPYPTPTYITPSYTSVDNNNVSTSYGIVPSTYQSSTIPANNVYSTVYMNPNDSNPNSYINNSNGQSVHYVNTNHAAIPSIQSPNAVYVVPSPSNMSGNTVSYDYYRTQPQAVQIHATQQPQQAQMIQPTTTYPTTGYTVVPTTSATPNTSYTNTPTMYYYVKQ